MFFLMLELQAVEPGIASAGREQVCVPAEQTPSRPVLHEPPPPGLFSSVWPLQLLSLPSQISAED